MGELPGLLPASSSLHSRPSIGGLGSSDTVDMDDAAPTPAVQIVDTSISKSPVNASNSECPFLFHFSFLSLKRKFDFLISFQYSFLVSER